MCSGTVFHRDVTYDAHPMWYPDVSAVPHTLEGAVRDHLAEYGPDLLETRSLVRSRQTAPGDQ